MGSILSPVLLVPWVKGSSMVGTSICCECGHKRILKKRLPCAAWSVYWTGKCTFVEEAIGPGQRCYC